MNTQNTAAIDVILSLFVGCPQFPSLAPCAGLPKAVSPMRVLRARISATALQDAIAELRRSP